MPSVGVPGGEPVGCAVLPAVRSDDGGGSRGEGDAAAAVAPAEGVESLGSRFGGKSGRIGRGVNHLFFIFSVIGWAWAGVALPGVAVFAIRRRRGAR